MYFSILRMSATVEKILDVLQAQAETTVGLLDVVFSDRYTSYQKARSFLRYGPKEFKIQWADWYRDRQRFYSLLNELKHAGLVVKKRAKGETMWRITKKGSKRLERYGKQYRGGLPVQKYSMENRAELVILSYDIPERERRKRAWIRENLKNLGFIQLHQSLWAGKGGLPEEFVHDLRTYTLYSYVHIFSVSRKGTIKKV